MTSEGPRLPEDLFGVLCRIWQQVLAEPEIDVDADFLEMGGDSIQALVIARRIGEEGYTVPPSAVLRRPTVRQLAQAIVDPSLFDMAEHP